MGFREVYTTAGSVFCVATGSCHSSSGSGAGPVFCVGDSGSCSSFYILAVGSVFFLRGWEALLPAISWTPSSSCFSSCPGSIGWELPHPSPVQRPSAVPGPISQPFLVPFPDPTGGHQCTRGPSASQSWSSSRTHRPSGCHHHTRDPSPSHSRSRSRTRHLSGSHTSNQDPSASCSQSRTQARHPSRGRPLQLGQSTTRSLSQSRRPSEGCSCTQDPSTTCSRSQDPASPGLQDTSCSARVLSGAQLHNLHLRVPHFIVLNHACRWMLFWQRIHLGLLTASIPLLQLLPVVIPVLQCLPAIHLVLGATQGLVCRRVWSLHGRSHVKRHLDGRSGPGHLLERLPEAVLLLLAEGNVLPTPDLLPSLGGLTRTVRRSSPSWTLFLLWLTCTLWMGCWRPFQRAVRFVVSSRVWRMTTSWLLPTSCQSAMPLRTSLRTLTTGFHPCHPGCAPGRFLSCSSIRLSAAGSFTDSRERTSPRQRHSIAMSQSWQDSGASTALTRRTSSGPPRKLRRWKPPCVPLWRRLCEWTGGLTQWSLYRLSPPMTPVLYVVCPWPAPAAGCQNRFDPVV